MQLGRPQTDLKQTSNRPHQTDCSVPSLLQAATYLSPWVVVFIKNLLLYQGSEHHKIFIITQNNVKKNLQTGEPQPFNVFG